MPVLLLILNLNYIGAIAIFPVSIIYSEFVLKSLAHIIRSVVDADVSSISYMISFSEQLCEEDIETTLDLRDSDVDYQISEAYQGSEDSLQKSEDE